MKKILFTGTVIAIALVAGASFVYANESSGFEYESNGNGTCTLSKIGTCTDSDIVIPAVSPNGDTVTRIGEYAFYKASDIESITFENLEISIANDAFENCEVNTLIFKGGKIKIGTSAFSHCDDIESIVFEGTEIKTDEYAFYKSGNDMDVSIKDSTLKIGNDAFYESEIVNLLIENSTVDLGSSCFSHCEDLETIEINDCSIEADEYAFYKSGDKASLTITGSEIEIENDAFYESEVVNLFIVDSPTVDLGSCCFSHNSKLENVTIESVEELNLDECCFYKCTKLNTLSINVDSENDADEIVIDSDAFNECTSLETVYIGSAEELELGRSCFSHCSNLKTVNIGSDESDVYVGDYAFKSCNEALIVTYGVKNTKPVSEEINSNVTESEDEIIEKNEGTEDNSETTEEAVSGADEITPEFKEYMDAYEAYMNEYCDFMESYDSSDASLLLQYTSLMAKAVEFEKVADYNEDNLSAEDYKYYLDVMNRINKRLIDTSLANG